MPQSGTQMSKNQLCYTCKLLLFQERVKCKASKSKSFLGYLKGQGHQRSFKLFPSILDIDWNTHNFNIFGCTAPKFGTSIE